MTFLYSAENIFYIAVRYGILLLNTLGVIVLLYTVVRCVIQLMKGMEYARINLAEGTALALSFKLGAEVLRTVNVHEWEEIIMLGAVIALRAALSFLIRWEIKNERKSLEEASSSEADCEQNAA